MRGFTVIDILISVVIIAILAAIAAIPKAVPKQVVSAPVSSAPSSTEYRIIGRISGISAMDIIAVEDREKGVTCYSSDFNRTLSCVKTKVAP